MVDFVDSFGSGVCMPLQILFSILAYMGSSGSWWWTTMGWWLWEGEDREIEKKRGIKIINKWIVYSCLLKNKTIDVIWLYQCGCPKYPFFYFYSKNKKYVDALHSCPNKSSNFYSIVHDVVLFCGGFVVWLWNLPLSYLYSLGQALPILPLGAANVYPVALCEWNLGYWKPKL